MTAGKGITRLSAVLCARANRLEKDFGEKTS